MSPMEGRGSRVLGPRVYKDMRCVKDLLDLRGLTRQPKRIHVLVLFAMSFWSTFETSIRCLFLVYLRNVNPGHRLDSGVQYVEKDQTVSNFPTSDS